ncbi:conserved hypothetical protein [Sporisorium reilianum SRZ2]|uniref:Uncharacterized protein n=1 Tax=Sporisorium reilianum (strain SRZ2) TaxID=999809 RepID=E6ZMZ4_SPORE|nr:conserved hypothetical protein [Sporisorium reilianum SRZ2]
MSQSEAPHIEAGPSSAPSRYVSSVRRCKTLSDATSTSSRLHHHATASSMATTSMLHQLALPIQLEFQSSDAVPRLRDGPVSPSKRGETLRAYSRQRRVFSGSGDRAPASPEQRTRALSPTGLASPSMRRPHPSRGYFHTPGFPDAAGSGPHFPRSSPDSDDTERDLSPANHVFGLFGDEPCSSMSSTPSLTSPTSTLSRSTSLRSAASDRSALMGGSRYLSLNGSSDLSNGVMENLSSDCSVSTWTRRARRWSNSVSRRMGISALNQTIHSTTTPYLKAGLQELRSIFDVDTLGVAVDDQEDSDLEGASPLDRRTHPHMDEKAPSLLLGAADAGLAPPLFESPETMSPALSRQSSSKDHELAVPVAPSRPSLNFTSQVYEPPATHRRAQSWRKHRSLSVSTFPSPALPASMTGQMESFCNARSGSSRSSPFYSTRETTARSQSVRTPLVAVALAALSVVIVGVCALETSMHPDAASLPLTTFMLAQSVFALVGVLGLALQRRWVIDLASRLIRAHVLGQVLIALAALRSLSRTAFYRHTREQKSFIGTAAAGVLTSPRFLAASNAVADPHQSAVGSFRDQLTYVCVFVVQAALPLVLALWAQYAVATALSRIARTLPSASQQHSKREQQSVQQRIAPVVRVSNADGYASERMRLNSENPTMSKGSSHMALTQRGEGWLGFVIARIDVNDTVAPAAKFELDATELSTRLEHLARAETPTQRSIASIANTWA